MDYVDCEKSVAPRRVPWDWEGPTGRSLSKLFRGGFGAHEHRAGPGLGLAGCRWPWWPVQESFLQQFLAVCGDDWRLTKMGELL